MEKQIGHYSFIVGVVIIIVLGMAIPTLEAAAGILQSVLIILGLIVGFVNISSKETKDFLFVALGLAILVYVGGDYINSWGIIGFIGSRLKVILDSTLLLIIPASIVVALKEIWQRAKGSK